MKLKSLLLSRLPIIVLAIAAGWLLRGLTAPEAEHDHDATAATAEVEAAPTVWTCSMDPQVQAHEPGACPICGMDLIAMVGDGEHLGPRQLRLSEGALALADIRTTAVERRAIGREIHLAGNIETDQTRESVVSNWTPGTLARLFVNTTGVQVRAGDHLAELYHPDLRTAEQELLDATAAEAALEESAPAGRRSIAAARVKSTRQSLLALGLSEKEIDAVIASGAASDRFTIHAPSPGVVVDKHVIEGDFVKEGTHLYTISDLSKVWVVADAYESDLAWLRFGQEVRFDVVAYPGRDFVGRIALIEPVLDPRTRTARVRINVENEDFALMPGMFARARVTATLTSGGRPIDASLEGKWMCPMHPEVIADEAGLCPDCEMDLVPVKELGMSVAGAPDPPLLIPVSAALITGRRAVVYVRMPAEADKNPLFEGRVVTLGPRAGDAYVVLDGLVEGEQVVVSGAFKVDSELQLKAKTSMMSAGTAAPATKQMEVPEVLRTAVGSLLETAVGVSTALSLDDVDTAQAESTAVAAARADFDLSLLGLEDGRIAGKLLDAVAHHARMVTEADDLAAARVEFEHLQHSLLALADVLGYELDGDRTVSVFHCPMAFDNRGADWLQWSGTRTENPYFGSGMYRCGSEQQVVATGSEN